MGAIALAAWLAYGTGHLGYDAFYALQWGSDLAQGRQPDFERQLAPTPHPLANVVSAVVSLLGDAAVPALVVLGALGFGALGFAAYELGARLFSAPVGALFALVLLTREELVLQELYTYIDIPYLALVLGAAALEAARPRRGAPVLALLVLAGLLRPEAWALTGVYAVWLAWGRPRAQWPRIAAAAAAAPVIWLLFDLLVTGDPLHSLHGTRGLAEQLARPRTVGDALVGAPTYIRWNLDDAIVIYGGVAGAFAALWLAWHQAVLPLAIIAVSGSTFLLLGLAGLPVLVRYMLLPSAMLALLFAFAVLGWTAVATAPKVRRAWLAAAAVLGVLLATSVPAASSRLDEVASTLERQRGFQVDLEELATDRRVRAAAGDCERVYVPTHHLVPQLAFWLDKPVAGVASGQVERVRRGLLVSPATETVQLGVALDPNEPHVREFVVPPDFGVVQANTTWILYGSC